jgi:glyoxylase I family protein
MDVSRSKRSYSTCALSSSQENEKDLKDCKRQLGNHHLWTISDAIDITKNKPRVKLPLKSFNHVAREVLSIEKSRRFYVDILGFTEVPRPPFHCDGYWLYGYGLSLHLVATTVPEYRRQLKRTRIEHFSTCLPQVDHIAFVTDDVDCIREVLDKAQVYYKIDKPSEGVYQLFMFDPDGNV